MLTNLIALSDSSIAEKARRQRRDKFILFELLLDNDHSGNLLSERNLESVEQFRSDLVRMKRSGKC